MRSDKTTVDDAIERMRVALSDSERHGSLKKIFQDIDTNNDDGISQQEFIEGMEKVFFFSLCLWRAWKRFFFFS